MAKLLEAIGLNLDVTGIAEPEDVAGPKVLLDVKVFIEDVSYRLSSVIKVAVATVDGT